MNLDIPEATLTDVNLVPINEKVRAVRGPNAAKLEGWMQIGEILMRS